VADVRDKLAAILDEMDREIEAALAKARARIEDLNPSDSDVSAMLAATAGAPGH
jgi:hypothetical protein